MTSALEYTLLYLEDYSDSLDNIAVEIQRNFTLIRDLRSRAQKLMRHIDKVASDIQAIKPTRNIDLTGALVGVAHSAEVIDMPVDPNEPTYSLCDQVSYGEIIGCDNPDVWITLLLKYSDTLIRDLRSRAQKLMRHIDKVASDIQAIKPTRNIDLTGALVGVAHSAEVIDMPVDPNEPTYSLCDQVSYGEIIGCDNPDCQIIYDAYRKMVLPKMY